MGARLKRVFVTYSDGGRQCTRLRAKALFASSLGEELVNADDDCAPEIPIRKTCSPAQSDHNCPLSVDGRRKPIWSTAASPPMTLPNTGSPQTDETGPSNFPVTNS
jgi:hypothetical protein